MWRGVIGLALCAVLLAGCSAQAGEAAGAQPSPAPSPRVAEAGADLYPTLEIAQAAGYAVHAEESDVSDSPQGYEAPAHRCPFRCAQKTPERFECKQKGQYAGRDHVRNTAPRVTSETHAASLPSSRVAEAKGDVKRNRPMSCAERNRKRVRVSGSFL